MEAEIHDRVHDERIPRERESILQTDTAWTCIMRVYMANMGKRVFFKITIPNLNGMAYIR